MGSKHSILDFIPKELLWRISDFGFAEQKYRTLNGASQRKFNSLSSAGPQKIQRRQR
jgi:hypothetical protein